LSSCSLQELSLSALSLILLSDKSLHRPRSSTTQSTYSVPFDLLGDFLKHINLLRLGIPHLQPLHNHPQPSGSLPAGCALTAALVLVQVRQSCYCVHDISGFVRNNHRCSIQSRLNSFKSIVIHH
ncbi:unnamed protein product, partial [Musa acuminata subsp. malaccensis]